MQYSRVRAILLLNTQKALVLGYEQIPQNWFRERAHTVATIVQVRYRTQVLLRIDSRSLLSASSILLHELLETHGSNLGLIATDCPHHSTQQLRTRTCAPNLPMMDLGSGGRCVDASSCTIPML